MAAHQAAVACDAVGVAARAQRVSAGKQAARRGYVAVALALLLGSCSASTETELAAFVPGQVVRLSQDAFGCWLVGDTERAAAHMRAGEYAAAGQQLRKENRCFATADPAREWSVHQVDGEMVQVGASTMAQHEAAKADFRTEPGRQYWVPAELIR